MPSENRNLTTLEYLINLRAIHYGKKCWVYLTTNQKFLFWNIMLATSGFELEGKTSFTMTDLIKRVQRISEQNLGFANQNKSLNFKLNTSKEAIRSTIYLAIPIFLNITQHGMPKIITRTTQGNKFIEFINNPKSVIRWLSKIKLAYKENIPTTQTNSSRKAAGTP
ncbi:MAG: hypothetical protein ACOCWG_01475 [bacterium]